MPRKKKSALAATLASELIKTADPARLLEVCKADLEQIITDRLINNPCETMLALLPRSAGPTVELSSTVLDRIAGGASQPRRAKRGRRERATPDEMKNRQAAVLGYIKKKPGCGSLELQRRLDLSRKQLGEIRTALLNGARIKVARDSKQKEFRYTAI